MRTSRVAAALALFTLPRLVSGDLPPPPRPREEPKLDIKDRSGKISDADHTVTVTARRTPSHELRGLSPFIEPRSDTWVFSGPGAGYHVKRGGDGRFVAVSAKVTVPYRGKDGELGSVVCWAPGGQFGTSVGQDGKVTFSGEGEYVIVASGAFRDEGDGVLTFETSYLTECLVVAISPEKEQQSDDRRRASGRKALGISAAEERAAFERQRAECETPRRQPQSSEAVAGRRGNLEALLATRSLAALVPTEKDVIASGRGGATRRAPIADSGIERPRRAFGPRLSPFQLAWRIDPADPSDRVEELVQLVADPCLRIGPAAARLEPTFQWSLEKGALVRRFYMFPLVHGASRMQPADAAPHLLLEFGEEMPGVGHDVLKFAIGLNVEDAGPFFDVVGENRLREGGSYVQREVVHKLVLKRSVVENGRFAPSARNRKVMGQVLDAIWYASDIVRDDPRDGPIRDDLGRRGPSVESISDRETARHVVRDYRVLRIDPEHSVYTVGPDGRRTLVVVPARAFPSLLRFVLDKRDGTVFLLPVSVDEHGKRIGDAIAVDLSASVEYARSPPANQRVTGELKVPGAGGPGPRGEAFR